MDLNSTCGLSMFRVADGSDSEGRGTNGFITDATPMIDSLNTSSQR